MRLAAVWHFGSCLALLQTFATLLAPELLKLHIWHFGSTLCNLLWNKKVTTCMACCSHPALPPNVIAVAKAVAGGSCTACKLSTCTRRVAGSAELENHFARDANKTVWFFPLSAAVQWKGETRESLCTTDGGVCTNYCTFIVWLPTWRLRRGVPRLVKGSSYILSSTFGRATKYCTCFFLFPTGVSKFKEGERIWQTCYRASIPSSIFFLCSQLCKTVGTSHVSQLKQRNKRGMKMCRGQEMG